MREIRESSFDSEVLHSEVPVIVDFWAVWCQPCRAMEPVLAALEQEHPEQVKVVKVNVAEAPQLAMRYMVQSVPTLLFFCNGRVVRQLVGAVARPKLEEILRQVLAA